MIGRKSFFVLSTCTFLSFPLFAFETTQSRAFTSSGKCGLNQKVGDYCNIPANQLRPTQLTFGAIEVERSSEKITAMSHKKLDKYIAAHVAPVVIGPNGAVYLTDHHHFAMAMAKAFGETTSIAAVVVQNWSHKGLAEFWNLMDAKSYTYLFDENGIGPKNAQDLPTQIFDLKNDSYRSLAWAVSNGGGYEASSVPHADFMWANYFRAKISKDAIDADFDNTVVESISIAHSLEAKTLPGYLEQ